MEEISKHQVLMISKACLVMVAIFMVCVVMDAYLWFAIGFHVPSWAISGLSLACAAFMVAISYLLKREADRRGT